MAKSKKLNCVATIFVLQGRKEHSTGHRRSCAPMEYAALFLISKKKKENKNRAVRIII